MSGGNRRWRQNLYVPRLINPGLEPIHSEYQDLLRCRYCDEWVTRENWDRHCRTRQHRDGSSVVDQAFQRWRLPNSWPANAREQAYRGERHDHRFTPQRPTDAQIQRARSFTFPERRRRQRNVAQSSSLDNLRGRSTEHQNQSRAVAGPSSRGHPGGSRQQARRARERNVLAVQENRLVKPFYLDPNNPDSCPVCLEAFTLDKEVALYPCGHRVCANPCYGELYRRWADGYAKCLICKGEYGERVNRSEVIFARLQPEFITKLSSLMPLDQEEQRVWSLMDRLDEPTVRDSIRARMGKVKSDFARLPVGDEPWWLERFKNQYWYGEAHFEAVGDCLNALNESRGFHDVYVLRTDLYKLLLSTHEHDRAKSSIYDRFAIHLHTLCEIYVPCIVNANHWVLIIIDLKKKTFLKYDPLGQSYSCDTAANHVQNWFSNQVIRTGKVPLLGNPSTYERKYCPDSYPRQRDSWNCGPYSIYTMVCKFSDVTPKAMLDETLLRARIFLFVYEFAPWIDSHQNAWKAATGRRRRRTLHRATRHENLERQPEALTTLIDSSSALPGSSQSAGTAPNVGISNLGISIESTLPEQFSTSVTVNEEDIRSRSSPTLETMPAAQNTQAGMRPISLPDVSQNTDPIDEIQSGPISSTLQVPDPVDEIRPGPLSTAAQVADLNDEIQPGPVPTTSQVPDHVDEIQPGPISTTPHVRDLVDEIQPGPLRIAPQGPDPVDEIQPAPTTNAPQENVQVNDSSESIAQNNETEPITTLEPQPLPMLGLAEIEISDDLKRALDQPLAFNLTIGRDGYNETYMRMVEDAGFVYGPASFEYVLSIPDERKRADARRLKELAESDVTLARQHFANQFSRTGWWLVPDDIVSDRTFARDFNDCLYLLEMDNRIKHHRDPENNVLNTELNSLTQERLEGKRWYHSSRATTFLLRSAIYSYHTGRFVPPEIFEMTPLHRVDFKDTYIGLPENMTNMRAPESMLVPIPDVSYYYSNHYLTSTSEDFKKFVHDRLVREYAYSMFSTWASEATHGFRGYVLSPEILAFLTLHIPADFRLYDLSREQVLRGIEMTYSAQERGHTIRIREMESLATSVVHLPTNFLNDLMPILNIGVTHEVFSLSVRARRSRVEFRNYRKRGRSSSETWSRNVRNRQR